MIGRDLHIRTEFSNDQQTTRPLNLNTRANDELCKADQLNRHSVFHWLRLLSKIKGLIVCFGQNDRRLPQNTGDVLRGHGPPYRERMV